MNRRKVITLHKLGLNRFYDFGYYHYNTVEPSLIPHKHQDVIELCFCLKGQQYYELEGELFKLRGNNVLIVPPNVSHSSGTYPEDIGELFWLQVSLQEKRGSLCNLPASQSDFLLRGLRRREAVVLKGAFGLKPILIKLLEQLEAPKNDFTILYINQLLRQLLIETYLLTKKPEQLNRTERQQLIDDFIAINLDRVIYVDELADLINVSTAYFKFWFKQNMGIPPKTYVNRLKIEHAKEVLMGSEKISQIAYSLGFSSPQYFATVFKKHTGLSPKDYTATLKK